MKIILATGIYPPDIGGPATYVSNLAAELSRSAEVVVVTYDRNSEFGIRNSENRHVVRVKKGLLFFRWFRYAKVLRRVGKNADIVYAFSLVSSGVPLWLARLRKSKKILRLGGDFFWERYTDWGGKKKLREWYSKKLIIRVFEYSILKTFDHVVFSTEFQAKIYENSYKKLPQHSVIENALPYGHPEIHIAHDPFRLIFMGRFVAFKNIPMLIEAVSKLRNVRLTMVGGGPKDKEIRSLVSRLNIDDRVMFVAPLHKKEKQEVFANHDLLVIPSITEISPNVALEARACGLPVLLTEETGLSKKLSEAMILRDLSSIDVIVSAIEEVRENYKEFAGASAEPIIQRSWGVVAAEHVSLFGAFVV